MDLQEFAVGDRVLVLWPMSRGRTMEALAQRHIVASESFERPGAGVRRGMAAAIWDGDGGAITAAADLNCTERLSLTGYLELRGYSLAKRR